MSLTPGAPVAGQKAKVGFFRRLPVWLSPRKIHKLELTNSFPTLFLALLECLRGRLAPGQASAELERRFRERFGVHEALIFPHARTACHFILKALDLQPGDEVLMTPLTIADMVNSVHTLGLRPVFVEMEPATLSVDVAALERAITPRSRALLLTYVFGVVPDMARITEVARRHNLTLIEDCSQCHGGSFGGRAIGTFGRAAFFSLTNFKIAASLYGGMTLTDDTALAQKLRALREREVVAPQPAPLLKLLWKNLVYTLLFSRLVFSYFTYFVILFLERVAPTITYRLYSGNIKVILGQHEHRLLDEFPAYYRGGYTDTQARVGLASWAKADGRTAARIKNGELLRELLQGRPGIEVPARLEGAVNVYWRFPVITDDMPGLKRWLLLHGIDTAPSYLSLCSREPGFRPYLKSLPAAERIKDNVLVVEVYEGLTAADIRRTAALIVDYVQRRRTEAR